MIPLRDSLLSASTPFITMAIILVNSLVFLYELSLDPFSANHFIAAYGLIPAHWGAASLFTSMFLHGGWLHIIGNMWFLWIFGDNVEEILGRAKYLSFYLGCGAFAGLTQVAFSPGSPLPMIGASGAIAGVMGAYMAKFPHARITTLIFIFIFVTVVDLPAVVILIYWFAIQFLSGVGSIASASTSSGGTAWFAHVGGFLAGYVLIRLVRTKPIHLLHRASRW